MKIILPYLFVLLLTCSCKVTEKNIVGVYSKDGIIVGLNPDRSFSYETREPASWIVKGNKIDSFHFVTKGLWKFTYNKLIINEFEKPFTDTDRIRSIIKKPTKFRMSSFSFKDIYGHNILFDRIDDENGNFAFIVDKIYSDYNIDLNKHKTLTFYPQLYKPVVFEIKDTVAADYTIILQPYYKQGYLLNKVFKVRCNKLIDGKLKLKRSKPPGNFQSPYIVHGH